MEVTHSQDPMGIVTRHIIERNYYALKTLESDYKKHGFETIFQLYDPCQGKWCLSVTVPQLSQKGVAI